MPQEEGRTQESQKYEGGGDLMPPEQSLTQMNQKYKDRGLIEQSQYQT
jgi:hypothetical protein